MAMSATDNQRLPSHSAYGEEARPNKPSCATSLYYYLPHLHHNGFQLLWLSGFVLALAYLSTSYKTSFAFEHPLHSALLTLLVIGLSVVLSCRFLPSACFDVGQSSSEYIQLATRDTHDSLTRVASRNDDIPVLGLRSLRSLFVLAVFLICVRVMLLERIINNSQCMTTSWAPLIPFAVALYECQVSTSTASFTQSRRNCAPAHLRHLLFNSWRQILSLLLLSSSAMLGLALVAAPRSTYICAHILPFHSTIPLMQRSGTFLDFLLLIVISKLIFRSTSGHPPVSGKSAAIAGWIALISSLTLAVSGFILFCIPGTRHLVTMTMTTAYASHLIRFASAVTFAAFCALQIICRLGVTKLCLITLFTSFYIPILTAPWRYRPDFPPISSTGIFFSLALATAGGIIFPWKESDVAATSIQAGFLTHMSRWSIFCFSILMAAQTLSWISRPPLSVGSVHPIETLIAAAELQHDTWRLQASSSKNLEEAAESYKQRYGYSPPPRFDRWFNYATLHSSLVVDDFDGMQNDLEPFWGLSPAELRARTWEAISNPWNGISGILIRDGRISIAEGAPGTHRWMLDGVASIIQPFVQWLPDMDLAFNLNDECRVAVPHDALKRLQRHGRDVKGILKDDSVDFSPDRAKGWKEVPEQPTTDTSFKGYSWQNTFQPFGSVGCPSFSPARRERHWDRSQVCATCTYSHTFHQFVSDWPHAADPCHQADLSELHGLHLSPAAFKTSRNLMPVFSQSKAHGYNDILYPSAWNYLDKARYEPNDNFPDLPFLEKETTLFWRGSTSEGFSANNGAWQGMVRQRLVHLFNNASENDRWHVLLPSRPFSMSIDSDSDSDSESDDSSLRRDPHYTYQSHRPSTLAAHLSTSLHIVDHIERCIGFDCETQQAEFAPQYSPYLDFQQHWRYKYLVDVDGAGFSGRFLPFLASHSLVLKAGLMREWWEDRVHAWVHFVPLDVRMVEVWSVLAFFAGWKERGRNGPEREGSGRWVMRPRDVEAERIAEAGRAWAGKVLRKKDMEVYLFRLLLEWGRLTDDRRDLLGWRRQV